MSSQAFPAFRFDGRCAVAARVHLRLDEDILIVQTAGGDVLERERVAYIAVSDPLERAPRVLCLPNGTTLEVDDTDRALDRALRHAGVRVGLAVRAQQRWGAVLFCLGILISLLAVGYLRGLPAAARWVAFAMPPHVEAQIGEHLLIVLDKHRFKPSHLTQARQDAISRRLAAVTSGVVDVPYRIEFRSAHGRGINAFALPGGTIVLLDGLVEFAENDEEVLAVLGHELGHVVHKHSMRQLLQSAGVGAFAGLLWGDFSGAAASVPLVLGLLHYSREAEREADDFAVVFLRAQGFSARPLYEFFVRMEARRRRDDAADIPTFLSTHPSTEERVQRLRDASH